MYYPLFAILDNGYNGKDIKKISVETGQVTIPTGNDRVTKYKMKDEVFTELAAQVENVERKYEFGVKNFNQLKFPADHALKHKTKVK